MDDAPQTPAARLSEVHATARVRSSGAFVDPEHRRAWRELLHAANALAWLAEVEVSGGAPAMSGSLDDAAAATACIRSLESVRITGKRGEGVGWILELCDAAARTLGMTTAPKEQARWPM